MQVDLVLASFELLVVGADMECQKGSTNINNKQLMSWCLFMSFFSKIVPI